MSVEEAAELARRAIYHATFRDGASGGVASGNAPDPMPHCFSYLPTHPSFTLLFSRCIYLVVVITHDIEGVFFSLSRWTKWMEKAIR